MAANTLMRTFHRVRMNIDQNLGRAEKSEVLNEEEQNVEKRVEMLKNVCQNIHKKIVAFLRSHGTGGDVEKRLKKLPESGLSHCLIESSIQFGQDTGSGQVFHMLGDTEGALAAIVLSMEIEIEQRIVGPVRDIVEVDYPSIMKLKKQLTSRILDMDSAKSRYASMVKQSQAGMQTKLDEARIEVEDASTKMEQTRDQLATEMYNFVSKESEISQCLQDLARIQADFHRQSLGILERLIPQMQENIEFIIKKPIFGQSLQEHLESDNREIAYVIEECIALLNEFSLEEEGLFRIAGSAVKIKKLKAAFNSSQRPVISSVEDLDLHVVSSVLKLYLRELPEPLMCSNLYNDWFQALQKPADQRLAALRDVINRLPKPNFNNLRFLIKFLAKLSEYSEVNKMSASNISLVIAPNLLWADGELGPNMLMTGLQSNIVEIFIANANYFFPGTIDFSGGRPPLSTPTSANATMFDGNVTPSSIGLGSITSNILSGFVSPEPLPDSSSTNASPGTLKRDKAPKKPPAPLPPGDKQGSSTESGPSHPFIVKSLSSGGALIGGGTGTAGLRLSTPDSGEVSPRPPRPSSPGPGPRHERPKLPPPERPQMPPPEKPAAPLMEKPAVLKEKPPGSRTTVCQVPFPQEKPVMTAKPVLVDADKSNAKIYPSLPDVDREPTPHQTHVRQSSYGGMGSKPPPRPKPPSPPPGRP